MIQRELHFYARQFLDETPTHSISSVMVSVEEGYACLKLSDGEGTATLDFFYRNASEAVQAEKKLESLRQVLRAFYDNLKVELATQIPIVCSEESVSR